MPCAPDRQVSGPRRRQHWLTSLGSPLRERLVPLAAVSPVPCSCPRQLHSALSRCQRPQRREYSGWLCPPSTARLSPQPLLAPSQHQFSPERLSLPCRASLFRLGPVYLLRTSRRVRTVESGPSPVKSKYCCSLASVGRSRRRESPRPLIQSCSS